MLAPTATTPDAATKRMFKSLSRALAGIALAQLTKEPAEKIVRRNWTRDTTALALVQRAAVTPTSTTSGGTDLAASLTASILAGLAPQSAAVRLFAQCLKLDFAGVTEFYVPSPTSAPVPLPTSDSTTSGMTSAPSFCARPAT